MLNYKPRNHEINVLYLAFSNLTKTIKVARDSLYEGDDNQALLNYHEVAQIFDQLNNQEKLGSCMNNLGCIYLKKDQYENSFEFLRQAIEI
jgi:tetratricopeptide (TPR) repeat protein